MHPRMRCTLEVSLGELVDRVTILELKIQLLPRSLAQEATCCLDAIISRCGETLATLPAAVRELQAQLKAVNHRLWMAEEQLHSLNRMQRYGEEFVHLARTICTQNDLRAALKRGIDQQVASRFSEPKSHPLPEITFNTPN
jgi:hypothetical protein